MSRLSCITELRDCPAMGAVEEAIETIRDWADRWGAHAKTHDPEEHAKTLRILGTLLGLQADEVQRSVREGEVMNIRLTQEAANDGDGPDFPPPAASAARPVLQEIAA